MLNILTPEALELHNEAWKQAKLEILGPPYPDGREVIPSHLFSRIALRAEEIRRKMEGEK